MHIYNIYVKIFKQEFILKQETLRRNVRGFIYLLILSLANVKVCILSKLLKMYINAKSKCMNKMY